MSVEVYLWVWSRGWKILRTFRGWKAAEEYAEKLLPYEVKVTDGTGKVKYIGQGVREVFPAPQTESVE